MGIFRDTKRLMQQAKEMDAKYPVADRLAMAQASFTQANQMLAVMAQGATGVTEAIKNGVDAFATITAARHTGTVVSFNPVIELDLLVMMPGGIPMPVTRREVVAQLDLIRAQAGTRLRVKVDPADASNLWINWAAPT